ncbi:MAG: hypothetical protein R2873_26000 [Caldilineaceae bacterium]
MIASGHRSSAASCRVAAPLHPPRRQLTARCSPVSDHPAALARAWTANLPVADPIRKSRPQHRRTSSSSMWLQPLTVHAARNSPIKRRLGVDSCTCFTPEPSQRNPCSPNPCPSQSSPHHPRPLPVCAECGAWFGADASSTFTACPRCNGDGCAEAKCAYTGLHPRRRGEKWQSMRLPRSPPAASTRCRRRPRRRRSPRLWPTRLQDEIQRRLAAPATWVGLPGPGSPRTHPLAANLQRALAVCLTSRLEDTCSTSSMNSPWGCTRQMRDRALPPFAAWTGPVLTSRRTIAAAATPDHAGDIGPGGIHGGHVTTAAPADLWQADTATGRYFSLRDRANARPRPCSPAFLTIRGAAPAHPATHRRPYLRRCAAAHRDQRRVGVGQGTFARTRRRWPRVSPWAATASMTASNLPVWVDQDPIGKNSRSNPRHLTPNWPTCCATILRRTPTCRRRTFWFNRPEGACPVCEGMGAVEIKMAIFAVHGCPAPSAKGRLKKYDLTC